MMARNRTSPTTSSATTTNPAAVATVKLTSMAISQVASVFSGWGGRASGLLRR